MPPASKRKSDGISVDASSSSKRSKTHEVIDLTASDTEGASANSDADVLVQQRQRLRTPDLEFDYDRSQLRDPRPTPGRVRRPRREERDLTEAERERFKPPPPPKPKGRLSAFQKNELFRDSAFRDPTHPFHHLYVCHRKGRQGSPTYDAGGFQLDYDKVCKWMKPQAYNKNRMVRGMEKSLAAGKEFDSRMFHMFFEEGDEAMEKRNSIDTAFASCIKDRISKDLDIPWHKIGMKELDLWEQKGLPKEKLADWLVFSGEDKKRAMKMLGGASLRK
ncbi:hypothetical protein PG996_013315 [Apiospora saccharicola]|uniref:NADAR domain-containing protein n=1 Tax=Apiospora saccharicola TaxID=335842 RepID=A0ABR1U538_9PEZI